MDFIVVLFLVVTWILASTKLKQQMHIFHLPLPKFFHYRVSLQQVLLLVGLFVWSRVHAEKTEENTLGSQVVTTFDGFYRRFVFSCYVNFSFHKTETTDTHLSSPIAKVFSLIEFLGNKSYCWLVGLFVCLVEGSGWKNRRKHTRKSSGNNIWWILSSFCF